MKLQTISIRSFALVLFALSSILGVQSSVQAQSDCISTCKSVKDGCGASCEPSGDAAENQKCKNGCTNDYKTCIKGCSTTPK